jgi:hypothetical protein
MPGSLHRSRGLEEDARALTRPSSNLPPLAALPVMRLPRDIYGRGWGLSKGLSGGPAAGRENSHQTMWSGHCENFHGISEEGRERTSGASPETSVAKGRPAVQAGVRLSTHPLVNEG